MKFVNVSFLGASLSEPHTDQLSVCAVRPFGKFQRNFWAPGSATHAVGVYTVYTPRMPFIPFILHLKNIVVALSCILLCLHNARYNIIRRKMAAACEPLEHSPEKTFSAGLNDRQKGDLPNYVLSSQRPPAPTSPHTTSLASDFKLCLEMTPQVWTTSCYRDIGHDHMRATMSCNQPQQQYHNRIADCTLATFCVSPLHRIPYQLNALFLCF